MITSTTALCRLTATAPFERSGQDRPKEERRQLVRVRNAFQWHCDYSEHFHHHSMRLRLFVGRWKRDDQSQHFFFVFGFVWWINVTRWDGFNGPGGIVFTFLQRIIFINPIILLDLPTNPLIHPNHATGLQDDCIEGFILDVHYDAVLNVGLILLDVVGKVKIATGFAGPKIRLTINTYLLTVRLDSDLFELYFCLLQLAATVITLSKSHFGLSA